MEIAESESFGLYFRRLRKRTRPRVTQQDAAEYAGVTQQYVSGIERTAGTDEEPEVSPEVAVKLAEAVGGTRAAALKTLGRDPSAPRYSQPRPSDSVVLQNGVTAELYSPGGRKIKITEELLKRLELEAELQQRGDEES